MGEGRAQVNQRGACPSQTLPDTSKQEVPCSSGRRRGLGGVRPELGLPVVVSGRCWHLAEVPLVFQPRGQRRPLHPFPSPCWGPDQRENLKFGWQEEELPPRPKKNFPAHSIKTQGREWSHSPFPQPGISLGIGFFLWPTSFSPKPPASPSFTSQEAPPSSMSTNLKNPRESSH